MNDPISLDFDEARWRRVGATDEEVEELRSKFDDSSDAEKAGLNGWMQSSVDSALTAWLNESFGQGDRPETAQAPSDGDEAGDESSHGSETGDGATGTAPGALTTGPNDGQETKPPEE